MTDSFLHNHQSALDSQREDDAIQYREDTGVYPNVFEPSILIEDDDYEPSDFEMMASFGTVWHDWI